MTSAQAAYDAAVKSGGTTNTQLASAAATVQKAQAALQQAQSAYDKVASKPNIGMLPQSLQLQTGHHRLPAGQGQLRFAEPDPGTDAQSKIQSAAAQVAAGPGQPGQAAPQAEDLTAAQASLDQAKANLAKLTAPATATDLQIQQAAVAQAEQTFKQAQLNLDNATLKAPFAGIVSQVNIVPGSLANSASRPCG